MHNSCNNRRSQALLWSWKVCHARCMSKRLVQCEPEAEVLYRDRPTLSPTSWLNERKSQVLADFNEDRSIKTGGSASSSANQGYRENRFMVTWNAVYILGCCCRCNGLAVSVALVPGEKVRIELRLLLLCAQAKTSHVAIRLTETRCLFLYKRGPSSELPSDTDTSQQPSQDDMSQEAKDLHRCPKCTFIDKPVYIPKHSESDAKLDNETILQLRCSYFAPWVPVSCSRRLRRLRMQNSTISPTSGRNKLHCKSKVLVL